MKIIFDEKDMYRVHFNEIKSTENVDAKTAKARAEKIVKNFRNALGDMSEFIGADEVLYEDMPKRERLGDGIMEREISPELIKETRKWLGKDGFTFFTELKKEHGRYDAVFADSSIHGSIHGSIPHPVHFREGMQVRNHMRNTGLCKDWNDHDFDDSWVSLIEKVVEGGRMSLKEEYHEHILDEKEASKSK